MLSLLLACVGLKQAGGFGFVFPREFSSLFRVSTWSLETLLACFAVAWRHRGSSPLLWSRWVRYSVVLRLWHGLGLLWLVSLWESSGPASRSALRALERAVKSSGAQESCKREKRERAQLRVVLNCPGWTSPTGGWSNQSVGTGRSPAHVQAFWGWCPRDPIVHSFRGRYKLTDYIYV